MNAPARERAILVSTCAAHAFTHIYMLLYSGVLVAMARDLELERDELLALVSVGNATFGLGAVPAGWLSDRVGEKPMLVAFWFLTALGGLVVGFAPSPAWLGAGMFAMGAGTSIFHPVGISLLSKGIDEPGRAMGTNGLWGSVGTAAGPFLAVHLATLHAVLGLDSSEAWRVSYIVLAVPMLAFGLWSWRAPIDAAPDERAPPVLTDAVATDAVATDATAAPRAVHWSALFSPRIAFLLIAMTFGGFYFNMITAMLPDFLASGVGFAEADAERHAGTATAAIFLIGGAGQLLAGRLVHGVEGRGLYVLILAAAAPLMWLTSAMSGFGLVGVAALMAIAMFMVQPVENTLLARNSPPSLRGILFGGKFVLVFGIGGLGTWLSGILSKHYGTASVFVGAALFTAAATVLALLAWRAK